MTDDGFSPEDRLQAAGASFEISASTPRDPGVSAARLRTLEIGSDTEIAKCVAQDLRTAFGPIVQDEGEFWRYDCSRWEAIPRDELWKAIVVYDGAEFLTPSQDPANVKLNKSRVESVLVCMAPLLSKVGFFASSPIGINCASGFITFDPSGMPRLAAHSSEHRQRHVLAASWLADRPQRSPARLLNLLLEGCFKGDVDKTAKIDLLAEVAGAAVMGMATSIIEPKALVLVGKQAENGKSQILAMIRSLLPPSAVSAISPAKFSDRTFLCHLAGKLLNAPDELSGSATIACDVFKQMITGDPTWVRDLYRSGFELSPRAQHIFATNTLPEFKDGMDRGVRRRLCVLEFNRVIPRSERLERIGSRIGEEEGDALLAWAIEGAGRVIRSGNHTIPASSITALLAWVYSSDPVLAWVESSDEAHLSTEGHPRAVKLCDLAPRFRKWAIEEGFNEKLLPTVNTLAGKLVKTGKGIIKRRRADGIWLEGISLMQPLHQPTPHNGDEAEMQGEWP